MAFAAIDAGPANAVSSVQSALNLTRLGAPPLPPTRILPSARNLMAATLSTPTDPLLFVNAVSRVPSALSLRNLS